MPPVPGLKLSARRRAMAGLGLAVGLGLLISWLVPGSEPPPGQDTPLLLPVSVEALTMVELVAAGKLHRFERDQNRRWFVHRHIDTAAGTHAHTADPAESQRIEQTLRDFAAAQVRPFEVRGMDPEALGLRRPELIAMFFTAGSERPALRLMVGNRDAGGGGRPVLFADSGMVALVAEPALDRLLALATAPDGP